MPFYCEDRGTGNKLGHAKCVIAVILRISRECEAMSSAIVRETDKLTREDDVELHKPGYDSTYIVSLSLRVRVHVVY